MEQFDSVNVLGGGSRRGGSCCKGTHLPPGLTLPHHPSQVIAESHNPEGQLHNTHQGLEIVQYLLLVVSSLNLNLNLKWFGYMALKSIKLKVFGEKNFSLRLQY